MHGYYGWIEHIVPGWILYVMAHILSVLGIPIAITVGCFFIFSGTAYLVCIAVAVFWFFAFGWGLYDYIYANSLAKTDYRLPH